MTMQNARITPLVLLPSCQAFLCVVICTPAGWQSQSHRRGTTLVNLRDSNAITNPIECGSCAMGL